MSRSGKKCHQREIHQLLIDEQIGRYYDIANGNTAECVCMRSIRSIAIMGWMIGLIGSVEAHSLGAEVRISGSRTTVEVYYDDDAPAVDAKVVIHDDQNRKIAEGRTDAKGILIVPTPAPGQYWFVADTGDGHVAKKRFTVQPDTHLNDVATRPDRGNISSDGPTRAESTGYQRWLLTGLGLAAIAFGTLLVRFLARHRSASPPVIHP